MATLYFAYGSNMDAEQMHYRCPGAEFVGTALLPGYMFLINDRGVATIIPKTDASVPGVVWQISHNDESALDRYEGHRLGLYDKCFRTVETGTSNTSSVLVYIDHVNTSPGASRQGYLDRILQAAEALDLPQGHQLMLRKWPAKPAFRTFNRLMNDIKSGQAFPDWVKCCDRHRLSRELKEVHDELVFEAINQCVNLYAEEEFDVLFEGVVSNRARELAYQHEKERITLCVVDYVALTRFLRQVEDLKHIENLVEELSEPGRTNELAGQGVIITTDPAREHAPEDRFVVMEHAPILANLWSRLFFHAHGIHPRTCDFMDAFANVAEVCKEKSAQDMVAQILACVQELATNDHHALEQELAGVRL